MRALLSSPRRTGAPRRTADRLGITRISQRQNSDGAFLGKGSSERHWLSLRNESAAGELAPRRGARGTAEHYRLFEVEEPHGGIQPRDAARRVSGGGRRSQCFPGTGCDLLAVCDPVTGSRKAEAD